MRTSSLCYRSVSPRTLRLSALALALLAALWLAPPPSAAVTIDWVAIGNPGNTADTPSTNCFAASCGCRSSMRGNQHGYTRLGHREGAE